MKQALIFGLILLMILVFLWLLPPFSIKFEPTAEAKIQDILIGTITAYSASENETDSSPRIAANNKEVFEGGIANNCLKFGQKVEINGTVFTVNDRMNRRYDCAHFDIFVDSKQEAIMFGRWKNQTILVLN